MISISAQPARSAPLQQSRSATLEQLVQNEWFGLLGQLRATRKLHEFFQAERPAVVVSGSPELLSSQYVVGVGRSLFVNGGALADLVERLARSLGHLPLEDQARAIALKTFPIFAGALAGLKIWWDLSHFLREQKKENGIDFSDEDPRFSVECWENTVAAYSTVAQVVGELESATWSKRSWSSLKIGRLDDVYTSLSLRWRKDGVEGIAAEVGSLAMNLRKVDETGSRNVFTNLLKRVQTAVKAELEQRRSLIETIENYQRRVENGETIDVSRLRSRETALARLRSDFYLTEHFEAAVAAYPVVLNGSMFAEVQQFYRDLLDKVDKERR